MELKKKLSAYLIAVAVLVAIEKLGIKENAEFITQATKYFLYSQGLVDTVAVIKGTKRA